MRRASVADNACATTKAEQKVGNVSQEVGNANCGICYVLENMARVTGLEPATFGVTGPQILNNFNGGP